MDVLLSAKKMCCCCGAQGEQPVYAETAAFADGEQTATLDGATVAGRLNRGMQRCDACGYSAPDLEVMPGDMSRAGLQAAFASSAYQDALRRRGAADAAHSTATRWVAYAQAFDTVIAPEQAGMAWVNAAAELDQQHLHRIGAADRANPPQPDQADAARRQAVTHLARVFDAEFGQASASGKSGLRRAFGRWRIGERLRRPTRWSARDHAVLDTSHEMRFELACTLADMLRRTGEFVAARNVALRALHTGRTPPHLAATLSFQLRLSQAGDVALYQQRDRVSTIVAFPVASTVVEAADLEFGARAVAA